MNDYKVTAISTILSQIAFGNLLELPFSVGFYVRKEIIYLVVGDIHHHLRMIKRLYIYIYIF